MDFGDLILVNFIIMTQRIYIYWDFAMVASFTPNFFYLISRACGEVLLFNSALILVLVLRKTITLLARIGFSRILPFEHHIYIHKVAGIIIFVQRLSSTPLPTCAILRSTCSQTQ